MSFEFSSKVQTKVNIDDFTNALRSKAFSKTLISHTPEGFKIGFKFANLPEHSWEHDAILEINENEMYLVVHTGTSNQVEDLITHIQNASLSCGLQINFEEL